MSDNSSISSSSVTEFKNKFAIIDIVIHDVCGECAFGVCVCLCLCVYVCMRENVCVSVSKRILFNGYMDIYSIPTKTLPTTKKNQKSNK